MIVIKLGERFELKSLCENDDFGVIMGGKYPMGNQPRPVSSLWLWHTVAYWELVIPTGSCVVYFAGAPIYWKFRKKPLALSVQLRQNSAIWHKLVSRFAGSTAFFKAYGQTERLMLFMSSANPKHITSPRKYARTRCVDIRCK